jgi:prepilin-type processing-associated H-X9-DG protein
MQLKTVWCEWDIGQHNLVFADGHVAERWLQNNTNLREMAESEETPFYEFYQQLVDECLIGIHDVELVE